MGLSHANILRAQCSMVCNIMPCGVLVVPSWSQSFIREYGVKEMAVKIVHKVVTTPPHKDLFLSASNLFGPIPFRNPKRATLLDHFPPILSQFGFLFSHFLFYFCHVMCYFPLPVFVFFSPFIFAPLCFIWT